jgi:hypothetical protein
MTASPAGHGRQGHGGDRRRRDHQEERGRARLGVTSGCHFAVRLNHFVPGFLSNSVQLNHFIPGFLSYSVAAFSKVAVGCNPARAPPCARGGRSGRGWRRRSRRGSSRYHITRPLAPPYILHTLHTVLLKVESYNDTPDVGDRGEEAAGKGAVSATTRTSHGGALWEVRVVALT